MNMTEEGLKAKGIVKTYSGKKVVRGISVEIFPGEVVGLLGPNGAGKTTSFYMIAGLVKIDQGTITLNGQDMTNWPIHLRSLQGLGYLPQEASIFRDLTVEENIYAVLEVRYVSPRKRKRLLENLLTSFGLGHLRRSKSRELSGGERRRVEIARTLAIQPQFILLDEPFAGVDPLAVKEVQSIIVKLKKNGIGILITDHNVRETLGIVDRAYIMSRGSLLISGTPQEIINDKKAQELYLGEKFKI